MNPNSCLGCSGLGKVLSQQYLTSHTTLSLSHTHTLYITVHTHTTHNCAHTHTSCMMYRTADTIHIYCTHTIVLNPHTHTVHNYKHTVHNRTHTVYILYTHCLTIHTLYISAHTHTTPPPPPTMSAKHLGACKGDDSAVTQHDRLPGISSLTHNLDANVVLSIHL